MAAKSRREQLAQLKALRASGKTRLSTYEVEDAQSVYDEVDEDGYKNVVRSRLDQDDFVVEDDGQGYADDGREEWHTERQQFESESEEELPARGKNGMLIVNQPLLEIYLTLSCSKAEA